MLPVDKYLSSNPQNNIFCGFPAIFLAISLVFSPSFSQQLSITDHPDDLTVRQDQDAAFFISATSDNPITYQWFKNGESIQGANSAEYVFNKAGLNDNGSRFACRVESNNQVLISENAVLTVLRPTRELITLTGNLTRSTGEPAGDGVKELLDVSVELYELNQGGEPIYREDFLAENGDEIIVENGKFQVRLGEGISTNDLSALIASSSHLFVQFHVGSPEAMETLEPRIPFTAVPFALSAPMQQLSGSVNPNDAGIQAPIGTAYKNTSDGTNWIRVETSWVQE